MERHFGRAAAALLLVFLSALLPTHAQDKSDGVPVLAPNALLASSIGNLSKIVPVMGKPFTKALRVTVVQPSAETNAVQLTLPNAVPVARGDAIIATFWLRGSRSKGEKASVTEAARVGFLFERSSAPWTKSANRAFTAPVDGTSWRQVALGFTAVEDYQPGEAMTSLRLAYGPQIIEIGGLSVVNLGKTKTEAELVALSAALNPLGKAVVKINRSDVRQTMDGFGGNYCQPRYGKIEPLDAVGQYSLDHLNVRCARVGVPMNYWNPEEGVYRDDAQAQACFLAMQELAKRKIPIVATVWEAPGWLVGGKPEESAKVLPRDKYPEAVESLVRFLTLARDKYQAQAEYFSFNEADYGINVRFTPQDIAAFIRLAGPRFKAAGLTTKFLVGDTANGTALVGYATPLLQDKTLAPYLGPIAFHCWDVLDAPDSQYTNIAQLGAKFQKPIWCTEAGFDAQLWLRPNPWDSWDSGLRLALAYARTLNLSRASRMYYWTYQDNYPLISQDATQEYPTFGIIRQFEQQFAPGTQIIGTSSDREDLTAIAALKNGKLSVTLVNTAGPGQVTLSGLGHKALLHVTTLEEKRSNRASTPEVMSADAKGTLIVNVPSRSVVVIAP